MELAWGPADTRGALAFVHIPPYAAAPFRSLLLSTDSSIFASHAVQALQANLDSTKNPGLNGTGVLLPPFVYSQQLTEPSADTLGGGSVQASNDPSTLRSDGPFWDALTANVKNLHAIISGHGTFYRELLQSDSKACL